MRAAPEHTPTRGATVGRVVGLIAIGWVFTFGVLVGLGLLVTRYGNGNILGDRSIPRWFEAHRTHRWTDFSLLWSDGGNTHWITYVAIVTGVLLLALTRHWRTVLYLVLALVGEVSLFLASSAMVRRPRPEASHLDGHLPTSSFPSGHVAATICLYATIALFAITRLRGWWRYLFLVPAVAMPALVAGSRMYRGMHHPTDVVGSMVLAAGWLLTLWVALRPNGRLAGIGSRDLSADRARTASGPPAAAAVPSLTPVASTSYAPSVPAAPSAAGAGSGTTAVGTARHGTGAH